ncbi:MAG: filamentous hemagglutinin family protein [Paucibacter sp.]|nr:filamentous hemagglutinin family protein [Roseateles sp.]
MDRRPQRSSPQRHVRRDVAPSWSPALQAAVLQLCGRVRSASLASVSTLLALQVLGLAQAWAQTTPLRIPTTALPSGNTQRSGTAIQYSTGVNTANGQATGTIRQTDATNIVNWQTFDVGSAATLNIVQPSSSAVLLNVVAGGAFQNKTLIEGVLNANGHVYLYNPNGIIFGKTATVDVNSLIASTLKFDESRVTGGLLKQSGTPVLGTDPTLTQRAGAITIEGDGTQQARISAQNGGLLMFAAPQVSNSGRVSAPDGQVILAAGDSVYLAAPNTAQTGSTLRGLVVEVANATSNGSANTSTAENAPTGSIDVGHGNATMIGYAVNQNGRVSAETSINLNGSVYLFARDQAQVSAGQLSATRTGVLTLGTGSVTEVIADTISTDTIPTGSAFARSDVRLHGQTITLQPGAAIVAPGGNVSVLAETLYAQDPGVYADPRSDNTRIDIGAGSVIDVSGSTGAVVPMENNVVSVNLRGTELADNPVLRASPLYGQTVQVDIRKGTPIANVQGWLSQVPTTLGQRNISGGTVSLLSNSSIILRQGSQIDVNGGWYDYAGGYVNTSKLQLGSGLVDVGAAQAGVAYTGVVNVPNSAANYEAGYTQGGSAGSVILSAPLLVMQGSLSGQVTRGIHQRDPGSSGYPLGGQLQVGTLSDNLLSNVLGWYGQAPGTSARFEQDGLVQLTSLSGTLPDAPAVGAAFDPSDRGQAQLAAALQIDPTALGRAGFSRLAVTTTGNIEVDQAIALQPGGSLALTAQTRQQRYSDEIRVPLGGHVEVAQSITAPSGSVSINGAAVDVADGVKLSTAGLWTNDTVPAPGSVDAAGNAIGPVAVGGGSVSIAGQLLQIGKEVTIDVSSGAWAKASGSLQVGPGGTISLQAMPLDGSLASVQASGLTLGTGLQLRGYGFGNGGQLKLATRSLMLGDVGLAGLSAGTLELGSAFFQQGGFGSYSLSAVQDLTVGAGQTLAPQQSNYALLPSAWSQAGGTMSGVATIASYGLAGSSTTRSATNLTLNAGTAAALLGQPQGRLILQAGSAIDLDPGARLNLYAGGNMDFEGAISAPAGNVLISSQPFVAGTNPTPTLWFGKTASIAVDGSTARIYTGANGLSTGDVLDAGSLRIGGQVQVDGSGNQTLEPAPGAIVMNQGAVFSAAGVGVGGNVTLLNGQGQLVSVNNLASNGGSIEVRSGLALELLGSFKGGAGAGALGGSLTLDLENSTGPFDIRQKSAIADVLSQFGKQTLASYSPGSGSGLVMADSLNAGNFAQLDLRSQSSLAFGLGNGNLSLSATKAVILDAPTLLSDSAALTADQAQLQANALATIEAQNRASGTSQTQAQLTAAASALAAQQFLTSSVTLDNTAKISISAPYVRLGDSSATQTYYPAGGVAVVGGSRPALAGNAALSVSADTIDLLGNVATQGFATTALSATHDLRFVGVPYADPNTGAGNGTQNGSLWTRGSLQLSSAQAYPTTLSDYLLVAGTSTNPNSGGITEGSGTVSFASSGANPGPVFSAGGSVTVYATHIVQAGQLLAPFGQITLGNISSSVDANLTADLSYAAGSVTSVAGQGAVPFGSVANGSVPTASTWSAQLQDGSNVGITQNPVAGAATPERYLPTKSIVSRAAQINVAAGAQLDMAGGGSMFAYEFTPGSGGSSDVLNNANTFAILPGYASKAAPVDGGYGSAGLQVGDAVWLSGMGSLPAGYYTLLPAHYALLPGAYAITAVAGTRNMAASSNVVEADGSMLIAGTQADLGSGIRRTQTQGFLLSSNAVVNTKSQFSIYDFGSYFSAKAKAASQAMPELPVDGGHVVFDATGGNANALQLSGSVNLAAAQGGQAGIADLVVPNLEITSVGGPGTSNTVDLSVDQLNQLQARSLFIGAIRSFAKDGSGVVNLTVGSGQLILANDSAHALTAPDLLLAAAGTLTLQPGAALRATGSMGSGLGTLEVGTAGALLRASSQIQDDPLRTGGSNTGGTLLIGSGATVSTTGSLSLDAGTRMSLDGTLSLPNGGALSLAAPSINVGDLTQLASGSAGLGLANDLLPHFDNLSRLSLNSYGRPIFFWGDVQLGSARLEQLNLIGAGLVSDGGNVNIQARNLRMEGSSATAPDPIPGGYGTLTVQADTIALGSQTFALRGFSDASFTANVQLLADGRAGVLDADQQLDLSASLITGSKGSSATFSAGSSLILTQTGSAPATAAPGLGASLSFQAQDLYSNAYVAAPSGQVGMSASELLWLAGGQVSVAGRSTAFGSTTAASPGGTLALSAPTLQVDPGTTLDVSAQGAAAGLLQVAAQTGLKLQGSLLGSATAAADGSLPAQGQFQLSFAGAAAQDFGAFNAMLNRAGFTQSRQFRYGSGTVSLGGSDLITARQVSIAVDNGDIQIDGQAVIDASGPAGGSIALYAAQTQAGGSDGRISLGGQARLLARGTGSPTDTAGSLGNGGTVLLSSANADGGAASSVNGGASLSLSGGSIDVSGATPDRNGSVTLRAPRTASGTDLAVASLTTQVLGSAQTVLEGVKVYQAGTISEQADSATNLDATPNGRMYQDAALLGANQAAVLARLQAPTAQLRPGIEVQSAGSLNVSVNEFAANAADRGWNLDAWRFGGQPINLTLRAAGTLDIVGSISDGFIKPSSGALGMPDWALDSGASASIMLVGGAALGAARTSDVVAGAGDVRVDFAGRTPDTGTPIKVAGSTQVVTQNPNAPLTNTDAPVALVRTGTGSISMSSGRDVVLGLAPFYVSAAADETVDTPVLYDATGSNFSYLVSLYGASVYTAGRATAANAAGFALPQNQLNTHYGASVGQMSPAVFASGGGALDVSALRDVLGAQNATAWYYRNGDGVAAQPANPTAKPPVAATPAQPGTLVPLSQVVPQLVDGWLFRQGRSSTDANGNVSFEVLSTGNTLNTAWWSRPDYFGTGLATFAGGDLTVSAGRDVSNLSASTATNAFAPTAGAAPVQRGGGDLQVVAGRDVVGGQFYVQKGQLTIQAGGALTQGLLEPASSVGTAGSGLNPILALGDAQASITAGQSLALETVYNPTITEQSLYNQTLPGLTSPLYDPSSAWNPSDPRADARLRLAQFSNFLSYGSDSAVDLMSLSGGVLLSANASGVASAGLWVIPDHLGTVAPTAGFPLLYTLMPGSLRAVALGGDVVTGGSFMLAPAPSGQFDLLAKGSVHLNNISNSPITMIDADPASLSTVEAPRVMSAVDMSVLTGTATSSLAAHMQGGLHANDSQPVQVVALNGDVTGDPQAVTSLSVPKSIEVVAGRDIVDFGLRVQHDSATDVSLLQAGRDVLYTTQANGAGGAPSQVAVVVGGGGRFDIVAGRNVDLGNSTGVDTRGNLDNAYLPVGGASVRVAAGTHGPDYAGFVDFYTAYGSAGVATSAELLQLASFMSQPTTLGAGTAAGAQADYAYFLTLGTTQQARFLAQALLPAGFAADVNHLPAFSQWPDAMRNQLASYLDGLGVRKGPEQLWAALHELPSAQQQQYFKAEPDLVARLQASDATLHQELASQDVADLDKAFFASLIETGKLGQKDSSGHVINSSLKYFDALIASLFPDAASSAGGDISLFGSQFKTEQGGAITLYAPAGSVYAGLTLGYPGKTDSAQGIFTVSGGSISSLVQNDFLVNKGRVFTLGGGDITLVSQDKDIDAGKGSKTAASAPPPVITVDPNGSVRVDVANSITGSGIATLKTNPSEAAGNVYAIAPRGVFDAGDAGVRSSGSVEIVAPVVRNADNINAAGPVVGASTAVAAPAVVPVAPANTTTAKDEDVVKAATGASSGANNLTVTVETVGFGEGCDDSDPNCKPDNDDPKKRKKPPDSK